MAGSYTPITEADAAEVWPEATPVVPQKSTWERATRKFKEEPLVPIGILATVVALVGASSALQKGNRTQFNKFLRYRVAAQGVTVLAALGGSVYYQQERKEARKIDRAAKGLPEQV